MYKSFRLQLNNEPLGCLNFKNSSCILIYLLDYKLQTFLLNIVNYLWSIALYYISFYIRGNPDDSSDDTSLILSLSLLDSMAVSIQLLMT